MAKPVAVLHIAIAEIETHLTLFVGDAEPSKGASPRRHSILEWKVRVLLRLRLAAERLAHVPRLERRVAEALRHLCASALHDGARALFEPVEHPEQRRLVETLRRLHLVLVKVGVAESLGHAVSALDNFDKLIDDGGTDASHPLVARLPRRLVFRRAHLGPQEHGRRSFKLARLRIGVPELHVAPARLKHALELRRLVAQSLRLRRLHHVTQECAFEDIEHIHLLWCHLLVVLELTGAGEVRLVGKEVVVQTLRAHELLGAVPRKVHLGRPEVILKALV
mmetsp:Transcript_9263/g.30591  ORF Transcript_9263/g.30591 Transcript_9263/m.30591 type:complete len:279 (+) Transcript_9263:1079-1915(+)